MRDEVIERHRLPVDHLIWFRLGGTILIPIEYIRREDVGRLIDFFLPLMLQYANSTLGSNCVDRDECARCAPIDESEDDERALLSGDLALTQHRRRHAQQLVPHRGVRRKPSQCVGHHLL